MTLETMDHLTLLPEDHAQATLVGRLHDPRLGPCVVAVRGDRLVDLTPAVPTMADLLDAPDPVRLAREAPAAGDWPLAEVLQNSLARRDGAPRLLAPCDLQPVKACGVTFARSMLERVIEERTQGDPRRAAEVRARIGGLVGGAIGDVKPGTPEAERVKALLIAEGLWSQYLEVGIGPDAEVFTKAPPMAAVGTGAQVGLHPASHWNNPEPELVLAVDAAGRVRGVTLGNDVNLRDIEGRSALLLGKAKDNNASCAIGPFVRLFDEGFGIDDARGLEISLRVDGPEGYVLQGRSSLREISRDLLDLVAQAMGPHHQYPDGMMLFTGTLFAPTEDRDAPGEGFTHKLGDLVRIASPKLGALVNEVTHSPLAPPWRDGVRALYASLARRGLPRA